MMSSLIIAMALMGISAFVYAEDWPMFRHDLGNTGFSSSYGPSEGVLLWSYTTGGGVYSSPAVVDGKVYVGSYDNKVYCLDASTGAHVWNYTTGSYVDSSPAVADGKVYIGSWDNKVYCLNASTGAHVWNYTTGGVVYSSPAVADGKVYIGSQDDKLYCLDASTGAHVWNYTTGNVVYSSPAVVDDKVYIGSYDNKVYCLDASTGAHVWNYTTGSYVDSSPAVADDKVYVGSFDRKLYCFGSPLLLRIEALEAENAALRSDLDALTARLDALNDTVQSIIPTHIALAVRGSNNGIYWRKYDGSTWGDWSKLPGATVDSPGIAVMDGNLHMVVIGTNYRLYHGWVDLETDVFSGWSPLSGSTPSIPILIDLP